MREEDSGNKWSKASCELDQDGKFMISLWETWSEEDCLANSQDPANAKTFEASDTLCYDNKFMTRCVLAEDGQYDIEINEGPCVNSRSDDHDHCSWVDSSKRTTKPFTSCLVCSTEYSALGNCMANCGDVPEEFQSEGNVANWPCVHETCSDLVSIPFFVE